MPHTWRAKTMGSSRGMFFYSPDLYATVLREHERTVHLGTFLQRPADKPLGMPIAIDRGGIDPRHAKLDCADDRCARVVIVLTAPAGATERPRSAANCAEGAAPRCAAVRHCGTCGTALGAQCCDVRRPRYPSTKPAVPRSRRRTRGGCGDRGGDRAFRPRHRARAGRGRRRTTRLLAHDRDPGGRLARPLGDAHGPRRTQHLDKYLKVARL